MNPRIILLAPLLAAAPAAAVDTGNRPGREVVTAVCAACHQQGLNGAPKIGDRQDWIARLKRGLPELSLSSIRGHGGMPARGGHAELTDAEIRNAIVYMFDPEAEARALSRPAAVPAPVSGPNDATVNGIEIHFGLVSAERLRAYPRESAEAKMHGGVPSGSGYYHVNVTLFDAGSHAPVLGAAVEVDAVQPGSATKGKKLESLGGKSASSYGQYVRLGAKVPSTFTVRIRPAGTDRVTEARFTPTPQ
jgi:cytochrome c5